MTSFSFVDIKILNFSSNYKDIFELRVVYGGNLLEF